MTFDILRVLEFIAVLGTAVATINRFLVRPIVDAVHRQAEESRALRGVMADIVHIRGELQRNGGTSLKDAVVRIETGMNELKGRMDAHIDLHLEDGRSS